MRRRMSHDKAKIRKEMLGTISEPQYFVSFPISKKTSLASCSASTMDPARENLLPSQNNKAFDTEKSPTAQFG
jgi:hypothetical protein